MNFSEAANEPVSPNYQFSLSRRLGKTISYNTIICFPTPADVIIGKQISRRWRNTIYALDMQMTKILKQTDWYHCICHTLDGLMHTVCDFFCVNSKIFNQTFYIMHSRLPYRSKVLHTNIFSCKYLKRHHENFTLSYIIEMTWLSIQN